MKYGGRQPQLFLSYDLEEVGMPLLPLNISYQMDMVEI